MGRRVSTLLLLLSYVSSGFIKSLLLLLFASHPRHQYVVKEAGLLEEGTQLARHVVSKFSVLFFPGLL